MKCWKVASHSYWKVSIKHLILFCRQALFLHLGQMVSLFILISGPKDDPTNYRGIKIGSALGKLFAKILNT